MPVVHNRLDDASPQGPQLSVLDLVVNLASGGEKVRYFLFAPQQILLWICWVVPFNGCGG